MGYSWRARQASRSTAKKSARNEVASKKGRSNAARRFTRQAIGGMSRLGVRLLAAALEGEPWRVRGSRGEVVPQQASEGKAAASSRSPRRASLGVRLLAAALEGEPWRVRGERGEAVPQRASDGKAAASSRSPGRGVQGGVRATRLEVPVGLGDFVKLEAADRSYPRRAARALESSGRTPFVLRRDRHEAVMHCVVVRVA